MDTDLIVIDVSLERSQVSIRRCSLPEGGFVVS